GDSELNSVNDFVQMLVEALHDPGADAPGINELLDAGIADANQGELGGCEECIGCHQEKDQKDPEQHKGDHGWVILASGERRSSAGADVGTAAPGCPVERSSTGFSYRQQDRLQGIRAFARRTAGGGCPHISLSLILEGGAGKFQLVMRYPF